MRIMLHGLFHTPDSQTELMMWIDNLSGREKAAALVAAMMTWNYLASQVNAEADRLEEHAFLDSEAAKTDDDIAASFGEYPITY